MQAGIDKDVVCNGASQRLPYSGQQHPGPAVAYEHHRLGSPAQMHMLKANGPAKDAISGNDAPNVDQRGKPRPVGPYDIGAVERQPNDSDLAPRLYPSFIRR